MATPLTLSNLKDIDSVERPNYAPIDLTPGIVHIGVGNFHRAHQALYLHDLFNKGQDHDWALIGAGVRAPDKTMRDEMIAQDFLTTLVELDPEKDRALITAPMVDFIEVAADNAPLIRAMSDPQIRIVSLTVTEGGYYINPSLGKFDPDYPDMKYDAANPETPRSVFGAMIAALKARREAGEAPFTIMSCDNLPHNGHVARDTVLGLARATDAELADWIESNVTFPNGMVDRITPATSDRERTLVRDRYGIIDTRPVACESFRQWVLEDAFVNGRPRFEDVGVTMTPNVEPYELMKIRILNGGHAAMAYPAALLGVHYVHDAAVEPSVRGFLDKLENDEIIPIVPAVPDTDLHDYYKAVTERLENPGVGDTIPRLCLDGSNRQPKFILPTTRDRLAKDLPVEGLALVSALWARYLAGTDEKGNTISIDDPSAERLQAHARRAKDNPSAFLEMRDIFGDLADEPRFVEPFTRHLNAVWQEGTEAVLARYINNSL